MDKNLTTKTTKVNRSYPVSYCLSHEVWDQNFITEPKLLRVIEKYRWCPSILKNNYRNRENFLVSHWCVLDFDEMIDLELADSWFSSYRCIIATTKHHQLPKDGKPPCDRFRVCIPWAEPITDYNVARYNMDMLQARYHSDESARSPVHAFKPSPSIYAIRTKGKFMAVRTPEPQKIQTSHRISRTCQSYPSWMIDFLERGVASNRNYEVHRCAHICRERGMSEIEAINLIRSSPTDWRGFSDNEMRQAIRSAYRKGF